MKIIDVRSDTVTRPTDEMRAAMAAAEVGDDVYGDDPTVNRMQELAAEILGKERALFVPSGTMGNQLCVMTHTRRGDDVIVLRHAHILGHEAGAAALLSGVTLHVVDSPDGIMHAKDVIGHVHDDDIHVPPTTLLCHENPLAAGQAVPLGISRAAYEAAKERGLNVHMDGARIFNAAAALGVTPAEIAACTDSVMICISKGLCAPVGSLVAGTDEFIQRAIRNRKILGGGMRQAGVLAAAGLYALDNNIARLGEDHENAQTLARCLQELPWAFVDRETVETNIVCFHTPNHSAPAVCAALKKRGVLCSALGDRAIRMVTSLAVTAKDIGAVTAILRRLKP